MVDIGAGVGPFEEPMPMEGDVAEDDIEVSRDLREEATSLSHLMTHMSKSVWRPSCQRAKMQQKPHRRGASLGPPPEHFGEQVTADHIVIMNESAFCRNSERDALVVMGRATKWIECVMTNPLTKLMPL